MVDLWKAAEEGDFGDGLDALVDQLEQKTEERDAILFVVDCSSSMFTAQGNDLSTSPVISSLKCVSATMQNKIISGSDDYVGLLLYNTVKVDQVMNFSSVCNVFPVDLPDAPRIKQLQSWIADPSRFKEECEGSADSAMLGNVFWACANILGNKTLKAGIKRIFVFTDRENPHDGSIQLQRAAKTRARDLRDLGITFELFSISHEGAKKFDLEQFWIDVMTLFGFDEEELLSESGESIVSEKFEELLTLVRRKENRKRALSRMNFSLGEGMNISVKLYSLYMETKKPSYVWIDAEGGELMAPLTEYVNTSTGAVVDKISMRNYFDIGGDKAIMTKEEISSLKDFGEPGISLIGFKRKSTLQPFTLTHSTFVFPDEFEVRGSVCAFVALHRKLLDKDMVAFCRYIPRHRSPPRIVALIPQEEELDESEMVLRPAGFNLVILPFADDIRSVKLNEIAETDPTNEQIELMSKVIDKLKLTAGFDPLNYENPFIQNFYANLQAMALEQNVEPVEDSTIPKTAAMRRRAGELLDRLAESFPQKSATSVGIAKKRTPATSNIDQSKKAKDGEVADLGTAKDADDLKRCTVPELKEYIQSIGLMPARLKAELIDQIIAHNNSKNNNSQ